MARSRSSVRPVVLGAVVLAAVLSGCSVTNQITTEEQYAASDGVRATLGDVTAENLLLIAEAADAPGALQGAFTNRGDEAVTVEVATTGSAERVRVAAGETVLLGGQDGEEVVLDTPAPPGATTEVTLSTGAGGTETVQVPVLDGTLPEYEGLAPTPEPEPEMTTQSTEEPAPTEEPTAGETTAP